MIWIPVALSLLSPPLMIALVWVVFRRQSDLFLVRVLDAIDVGIRKQDDRIRKGKTAEPERKEPGMNGQADPFGQAAPRSYQPGQPIDPPGA